MNILITAGPTREPIDAVRYIGNRSSGKLGFALANAAASSNHSVTLLMGPGVNIPPINPNINLLRFESTADLQSLLQTHFPTTDLLIMAAAVADYTPITQHTGKLPRSHNKSDRMTIELKPTPDLTASLAPTKQPHQRIIAFALEDPAVLEQRAVEKMKRKKVDAIVANPLGTMDSDTITPILFHSSGSRTTPGTPGTPGIPETPGTPGTTTAGSLPKSEFASWLLTQALALFSSTNS